jgi:L-lysine 6-transaminase
MNYPGPKSEKMLTELGHYVIVDPYPFVLGLPKCRVMRLVTIDGQEVFD